MADHFFDRAGEHRQAADVQHVVGASLKSANGSHVRHAASAAFLSESGKITDQETELRRSFRDKVGGDRQSALPGRHRRERLWVHRFPDLAVLQQVRVGSFVPYLSMT